MPGRMKISRNGRSLINGATEADSWIDFVAFGFTEAPRGSRSKPTMKEVNFTRRIDQSSQKLMLAANRGISGLTVEIAQLGPSYIPMFTLTGATISKYIVTGLGTSFEAFSVASSKMTIDPSGRGFDISDNVKQEWLVVGL